MRGALQIARVALAGMALAGCGSAAAPAASISPSLSATGTSAIKASASAVASPPPACSAASLELRGGRIAGGTGTAHADLYFTNVGPAPCSLMGQPKSVVFLIADGSPLAVTTTGPEPDPVPPATLAPGVRDAASVAYNWANWCGKTPGPLRVRVELPDGGSVTGPFDGPPEYNLVPRCDNPSAPSTLILLWGFTNPTP